MLVIITVVISLKNKLWIILIIFIIVVIGVGIYLFTKNNSSNKSSYSAQRSSTNQQYNTNTDSTSTSNSISSSNSNLNSSSSFESNSSSSSGSGSSDKSPEKKEDMISSFTTKIYSKDSARQNNISITCASLNDTIIPNDSTFSFCNTVGKATSDKGYQEADIFDNQGNKKKGLGGGNCQVSTTLYNAVLKVSNLSVVEKHEHSNKVPYIETGKDAAVAYGSYDLKFKNETGHDIKIKAEANENNITITLYALI